jgi:hypothetical protein
MPLSRSRFPRRLMRHSVGEQFPLFQKLGIFPFVLVTWDLLDLKYPFLK